MEIKNMVPGEGGKQIALWAYKLGLYHPITKELMEFKALPEINRYLENYRRFTKLVKYFTKMKNKKFIN